MLKNIKVDIIYYLIGSDFEMEFNLCGCCRMRLLTDKATDKKGFVGMLARAVSRSRVIIGCGALFGSNGLISTVAAAIGQPLVSADNAAYGIKTSEKIDIIQGSTPLVTTDGLFGGCLIERGPQTIILLSESKSIRKNVMKNLIHPYIEQMSVLPEGAAVSTDVPNPPAESAHITKPEPIAELPKTPEPPAAKIDPLISELTAAAERHIPKHALAEIEVEESAAVSQEPPASPQPEIQQIAAEQPEPAPQPETVAETPAEPEQEEDSFSKTIEEINSNYVPSRNIPALNTFDAPDLVIEPEQVKFSDKSSYALDYTPSHSDQLFLSEPDDVRPKPKPMNVTMIVVAAILLILVIVLAYLLIYTPLSQGMSIGDYFSSIFEVAEQSSSIPALKRF